MALPISEIMNVVEEGEQLDIREVPLLGGGDSVCTDPDGTKHFDKNNNGILDGPSFTNTWAYLQRLFGGYSESSNVEIGSWPVNEEGLCEEKDPGRADVLQR